MLRPYGQPRGPEYDDIVTANRYKDFDEPLPEPFWTGNK
jgi:hypothetical protein